MTMSEVSLVLDQVERGAVAVEKETHVLWSRDDLLEAQSNHQFDNEDRLIEPTRDEAVTSLYPGCPNMVGKIQSEISEPIAQTSHFLLFRLAGE
jgi:hypothetical protein